ncbi:MAG: radical SAM protein [Candidatus Azambacteria bacterium]|nr:radical SAM protein [Candidatus Azambacteria bacterium]
MKCSFCLNNFGSLPRHLRKKHLTGEEWIRGLNRIVSRPDLPLTLQGGEPTLHKDFAEIINGTRKDLNIDVLTNLRDEKIFLENIAPDRLKRKSPYASIRVSFYPGQMDIMELKRKVLTMLKKNFSIGIWGVMYPPQKGEIKSAQKLCQREGIDFRTKEFLGEYKGKMYGQYKHREAVAKKIKRDVYCRTTELLIGPDGSIYRCTADVYESRQPIGHILDPGFQIDDKFRPCSWFGHCNPCDIKVKTNRFQKFGHSSVEVVFLK